MATQKTKNVTLELSKSSLVEEPWEKYPFDAAFTQTPKAATDVGITP